MLRKKMVYSDILAFLILYSTTYVLQYSQSVTMYMHLQNASSKKKSKWDKLNLKRMWHTSRLKREKELVLK